MDIQGEYTFEAPQALVWEALRDPDVLGTILPGGEGIEEVGENHYKGVLKVRVGPVQGKFKGDIQLSDIVEPNSYTITVDGKGAPGFVKASGGIQLTEKDGYTHMTYEGTAKVGGRIASAGQRLMDTSAKSIIRQSLEALNEYLKVKQMAKTAVDTPDSSAPETTSTPPKAEAESKPAPSTQEIPTYTPPSQNQLAMTVAKDVFDEYVPTEYQPLVLGAVGYVLAAILHRLLDGVFGKR